MLMERQTVKFFCRGYYLMQMKNAEHSALGSLAHSAELKGRIEKLQLFHLLPWWVFITWNEFVINEDFM